jgi:branched-chain amino acid transport system permease protein
MAVGSLLRKRRSTLVSGAVVLGIAALVLLVGDVPGRPVLVQALVTGLLLGGVYSLVSMGLALIFGVLDIINFAHGAMMGIAMYLSYTLVSGLGFDPYLSILVTVPALFLLGLLVQRFLIDRIMGQPTENQLLLTLGLALLIQNALLLIFTGTPQTVRLSYSPAPLNVFGAVADVPRVVAFLGSLLLAGLLYLVLRRTTLGTAVRAVAENPEGAAMVGINVRRIYVLTFGLGTACVGAAGTLVLPFLPLQPVTGEQFNIIAFVVVVLGGLGNVVGALLGGLLIGLVQELGGAFFPGVNKLLIVFVVFVLTLLFRPQGLLGGGKK